MTEKKITLHLTEDEYRALKETRVMTKFARELADRKLSISQMAKETGLSRPSLTNMYYGKAKGIQFDTVETLCKYFGKSVQEVMEMFLEPY